MCNFWLTERTKVVFFVSQTIRFAWAVEARPWPSITVTNFLNRAYVLFQIIKILVPLQNLIVI